MSFLNIFWLIIVSFVFLAYLLVLFSVVTDMFKDSTLRGIYKILWTFSFIFFPFLSMIIYFIARGKGMAQRREETMEKTQQKLREVYGVSPAAEIAQAKKLLDEGAISEAEFESIKNKAIK